MVSILLLALVVVSSLWLALNVGWACWSHPGELPALSSLPVPEGVSALGCLLALLLAWGGIRALVEAWEEWQLSHHGDPSCGSGRRTAVWGSAVPLCPMPPLELWGVWQIGVGWRKAPDFFPALPPKEQRSHHLLLLTASVGMVPAP